MKAELNLPEVLSYVGRHSELPGLQSGYQVRYSLRGQAPNFEVVVARNAGSQTKQVAHPLRCLTLAQAKCLVCYLYENAVEPDCVADILADLQESLFSD